MPIISRLPDLMWPACPSRVRLWLGLASLLLLLPAGNAVAEDLHGRVCSSAVEVMLGTADSPTLSSPQVDELRALLPRLDSRLQPSMQRLLGSMDGLFTTLRNQQPPSQQQREEFNDALLNTLILLQPPASTPDNPLSDLPERLDFALVLYVSWAQIGRLRPALERRDSYLGWVTPDLAKSIERDLLRDDWLPGAAPEQQRLLADARRRWNYIARLLYRPNAEPAPFSVKTQIEHIRDDLVRLREPRDA